MSTALTRHAVILAGGKSQLPYVKAFKDAGWHVTSIDRDANAPAKTIADTFITHSIYDYDGLAAQLSPIHEQHPIHAIYSNSSAAPVARNVAALNLHFICSYPSFSRESVERCYDKTTMRQCLLDAKVPLAKAFLLEDVSQADLPVIIKPGKDSLGGTGVKIIEDMAGIQLLSDNKRSPNTIIEAFIEGIEYSVDGLVVGHELDIISISEKITEANTHGFIPQRFTMLASDHPVLQQHYDTIYRIASDATAALDIHDSQISLDIKIDDAGAVMVIEGGLFWDSKIDRLWQFAGLAPYDYFVSRVYHQQPSRHNTALVPCAMDFLYASEQKRFTPDELVTQFPNDHIEYERTHGDEVGPPASVADMLACRFYKA